MSNKQYTYQNQYNREHYARLSIQVAIQEREAIDTHWRSKGYKSFNAYANDLIRRDMSENVSAHSVSVGDVNITQGDGNTIHIG